MSSFKLFLIILICGGSAIGLIFIKHESRELFIELEAHKKHRDQLNIEWNELKSEEIRLGNPARIEQQAIEALDMKKPAVDEMRIYKK